MTMLTATAYQSTQERLETIATLLGLDRATWRLLRNPVREYKVTIPVRLENGQTEIFHGYRVHHNDSRGPCAGREAPRPHRSTPVETEPFTTEAVDRPGELFDIQARVGDPTFAATPVEAQRANGKEEGVEDRRAERGIPRH